MAANQVASAEGAPLGAAHSDCAFFPPDEFVPPRIVPASVALLLASALSLSLVAYVAFTYYKYKRLRRHPNSLILARALADGVLAFHFVLSALQSLIVKSTTPLSGTFICTTFSFVTQTTVITSELMSFCLVFDLILGLQNPFTDYAVNTRRYHWVSLALAAADGFALVGINEAGSVCILGDNNPLNVCWINWLKAQDDFVNPYTTMFFYVPLVSLNVANLVILLWPARRRLARGLPATSAARLEVYSTALVATAYFLGYYVLLSPLYYYLFQAGTNPNGVALTLFAALIGLRGAVTAGIWISTNDVEGARRYAIRRQRRKNRDLDVYDDDDNLMPQLYRALREEVMFYTALGVMRATENATMLVRSNAMPRSFVELNLPRSSERLKSWSLSALLCFQCNARNRRRQQRRVRRHHRAGGSSRSSGMVRRASHSTGNASDTLTDGGEDMVQYGSSAVMDTTANSSLHATLLGEGPGGMQRTFASSQTPSVALGGVGVHGMSDVALSRARDSRRWSIDEDASWNAGAAVAGTFKLVDFEPMVFHRVRRVLGVDDTEYMQSISQLTGGHINEGGRSGAFMFYSVDKQYIVKTVDKTECDTLRQMADSYADFLHANPNSLLTRFMGCYCITMYSQDVYFIVMRNILATKMKVHDLYDLKGSTVNRNARPPRKGKLAYCRHCEAPFRVGVQAKTCKKRPGRAHEPWRVLKDNDLNYKLRLGKKTMVIASQLRQDADWLRRHNVMDYSLLVGVHRARFKLNPVPSGGAPGAPRPITRVGDGGEARGGRRRPERSKLSQERPSDAFAGSQGEFEAKHASSASSVDDPLSPDSRGSGGAGALQPLRTSPLRTTEVAVEVGTPAVSVSDAVPGEHGSKDDSGAVVERSGGAIGADGDGGDAAAPATAWSESTEAGSGDGSSPSDGGGSFARSLSASRRTVSDSGSLRYVEDSGAGASSVRRRQHKSRDRDRTDCVLHQYNGGMRAEVVEGPEIYFLGIVDMLKRW